MTATLTTLVSFNGTNGANPAGSLIADANGDLFVPDPDRPGRYLQVNVGTAADV